MGLLDIVNGVDYMNKNIIRVFKKTKTNTITKKYIVKSTLLTNILAYLFGYYYDNVIISQSPKHNIDTELNFSTYKNSLCTYSFDTYGNTFKELLDNVIVYEYDQYGEGVKTLSLLDDLDLKLHNEIVIIIQKTIGFNNKLIKLNKEIL